MKGISLLLLAGLTPGMSAVEPGSPPAVSALASRLAFALDRLQVRGAVVVIIERGEALALAGEPRR